MLNTSKLKGRMALMNHTQKSLVNEMNLLDVKITENTFSSKLNGKSTFTCDEAAVICNILKIVDAAERAEIFLA